MKTSRGSQLLSELSRLKWNLAYKGIIVGIISGILVSIYRLGIEFGTETAVEAYRFLSEHPVYILLWLPCLAAAAWAIYKLIQMEPYAKGSGIPQVKGIVLLGMKMKWHTILIVRFVAGILASFFGLSVGREGPSIQIGAAGTQAFAKRACKNKVEKNYIITAGAAAGLSSAFNAPLSGIIFALEEVHRSFSPHILVAATAAALTADLVSNLFFGLRPVFDFIDVPELPLHLYGWLLLTGIAAGVVGALTNKGLLYFSRLYEKVPPYVRPAIALLLALFCGLLMPQVLGGGQNLIQLAAEGRETLLRILILLAAKQLFTFTSFGSGVPGGIFLPILSIGALTGGVIGKLAIAFYMPETYLPVLCVCAMAGAMAGSVKAPITSILLMAEMTGSLVQMLPVAIVAFVALFTSDLLKTAPIYEVLLDRLSGSPAHNQNADPKRTLVEAPVELGSMVAGRRIKDISWPKGVLLVGLRRGEQEIIPNGDTLVLPGDYVVAMSNVSTYEEMNRLLCSLCHAET